ncbi:MAG: EutN/CcmL family microcompartment protein [Planctomycetota bacterium]
MLGSVTLSKRHASLKPGRLLIAEPLDGPALDAWPKPTRRRKPLDQSLVVYDELGAGVDHLIALSEGAEATAPFYPDRVPIDAYNAAILDTTNYQPPE